MKYSPEDVKKLAGNLGYYKVNIAEEEAKHQLTFKTARYTLKFPKRIEVRIVFFFVYWNLFLFYVSDHQDSSLFYHGDNCDLHETPQKRLEPAL